jgi:WD40 repeat protein
MEVAEGKPAGQPQLIKRDIGRIQPMGFARNGSFYYGLRSGIRDIHVARIDPATGKILEQPQLASQRFLGANRGAEWSPDGENMAYFVNLSNTARQPTSVVIRSLNTGQERELIGSLRPNLNIRPRWSPDGRWLLVGQSRGDRGRQGLYRVDAQTGAATQVVTDSLFWGVWTPDSKSIVYAQRGEEGKGGGIRMRNLDTGEDRELFRPEQSMFVSNLALSPDGRRLAFGMSTLSPIIAQVLTVVALDSGSPRELWRGSVGGGQFAGLNWTRDGTHLFFAKGGEMWRIRAEGGQPESTGLHPNGSDGFALHSDGRVAFVTGENKEEIWVLENFLPTLGATR